MTSQHTLEMHQQHRDANIQIESWLDDINMWRAEHKQALAWLSQLETYIHKHDVRLHQHAGTVEKQQRHIRQHEHAIALNEQAGKYPDQSRLNAEHETFVENQKFLQEHHERTGQIHREETAVLLKAIKEFIDHESAL